MADALLSRYRAVSAKPVAPRKLPVSFEPDSPLDACLAITIENLDKLEKTLTELERCLHKLGGPGAPPTLAPPDSSARC